jgi:hypothetical protein
MNRFQKLAFEQVTLERDRVPNTNGVDHENGEKALTAAG